MSANDLVEVLMNAHNNEQSGYSAARDVIIRIVSDLKKVPENQRDAYLDSLLRACMGYDTFVETETMEERDNRFLGK